MKKIIRLLAILGLVTFAGTTVSFAASGCDCVDCECAGDCGDNCECENCGCGGAN